MKFLKLIFYLNFLLIQKPQLIFLPLNHLLILLFNIKIPILFPFPPLSNFFLRYKLTPFIPPHHPTPNNLNFKTLLINIHLFLFKIFPEASWNTLIFDNYSASFVFQNWLSVLCLDYLQAFFIVFSYCFCLRVDDYEISIFII